MQPPLTQPLSASDLYALSQGSHNEGNDECYWCASRCKKLFAHNEPPPLPFVARSPYARRPGSRYICVGCWLWKRQRITIRYLDNRQDDLQTPPQHSWFVTDEEAWAIRDTDGPLLYPLLLKPPRRFFLAIKYSETKPIENRLQTAIVNDLAGEVRAGDRLTFTINGAPHNFTPYELELALRGNDIVEAGPRELIKLYGQWVPPSKQPEKRGRGRPSTAPDLLPTEPKTVLLASGVETYEEPLPVG